MVALNSASDVVQVSTRARVSYGILTERAFPMDFEVTSYKGNGEVGLKQAYGTDPAGFIPIVEVFSPTKGSYSADTAFLKQKVIGVDVITYYLNYQY